MIFKLILPDENESDAAYLDADGHDMRVQSDEALSDTVDSVLDVYDSDLDGYVEYVEFRQSKIKFNNDNRSA